MATLNSYRWPFSIIAAGRYIVMAGWFDILAVYFAIFRLAYAPSIYKNYILFTISFKNLLLGSSRLYRIIELILERVMSIAQDKYNATGIGQISSIQALGNDRNSLEDFKLVIQDFESLEDSGLVEITHRHEESQINGYTDHIIFRRLE